MPITTELQNSRELREARFTDRQAEKLAELLERSVQQGFERFAETLEKGVTQIRNEISLLESRMEARFAALEGRMEGLEGRMKGLEGRMETRFEALEGRLDIVRADLRAEFHSSLRDQMRKFFAIMVGLIFLAVAIIKLFPNLY